MTGKCWCLCLLVHLAAFTQGLSEENVELTRSKRRAVPDGGVLSGAAIAAGATITSAIIGEIGLGTRGSSGTGERGGCKWVGTSIAGFCGTNHCPTHNGYELVERSSRAPHNDRRGFGSSCFIQGKKALCCRSKKDDNTWDGQWESASSGGIWRCTVRGENNRCNRKLECSTRFKAGNSYKIDNEIINYPKCDRIEYHYQKGGSVVLLGQEGKIRWLDNSYEQWFKV